MRVSIFLGLTSISFALSQESISVTTSLITYTITQAPSTIQSGLPGAFIGYSTETALGAYTSWDCPPGQIWSRDGSYARCCDDSPNVECGIGIACLNTSLIIGPNSQQTWTCSGTASQTTCVTGIVYPNISATQSNQAVTNIQCWPSWNGGNWNATREIPITSSSSTTITTPSLTTTSVSSASTLSPSTSTPSPSTITPSSSAITPSSSASALSPGRGLQTGAIIGIVVGIVILVVIVIFLNHVSAGGT